MPKYMTIEHIYTSKVSLIIPPRGIVARLKEGDVLEDVIAEAKDAEQYLTGYRYSHTQVRENDE